MEDIGCFQGLNFLVPFVEKVKYVQSLKEIAIDIPQQSAITSGTAGATCWRVADLWQVIVLVLACCAEKLRVIFVCVGFSIQYIVQLFVNVFSVHTVRQWFFTELIVRLEK